MRAIFHSLKPQCLRGACMENKTLPEAFSFHISLIQFTSFRDRHQRSQRPSTFLLLGQGGWSEHQRVCLSVLLPLSICGLVSFKLSNTKRRTAADSAAVEQPISFIILFYMFEEKPINCIINFYVKVSIAAKCYNCELYIVILHQMFYIH